MGKSSVLAVLVALLTIPSVVLLWMNQQLMNPDRYVATVAPLASYPQVRATIADRVTIEVITHLDLSHLLSSMAADLPPSRRAGTAPAGGPD